MEGGGNSSTSVTEGEEFQNSSEEALNPHQCAVGCPSGAAELGYPLQGVPVPGGTDVQGMGSAGDRAAARCPRRS